MYLFFFHLKILLTRLIGFTTHRYDSDHPLPASVIAAWQLLGYTVYLKNPYGHGAIMLYRPALYQTPEVNCFFGSIRLSFRHEKNLIDPFAYSISILSMEKFS